eukprot:CAMPEP_0197876750 /NCGR_PEP_ID=MMETSP1439-20131203/5659_1 /TAXON_ID=66791 /ORGANISM="Gonyaulax spinifera, Strain CCMP409" /LENGTH=51 /DNA_ID=CAMNT_0043496049 /DNA_START=101 /DNA_END=253 /DNA_ORIENTATION=+
MAAAISARRGYAEDIAGRAGRAGKLHWAKQCSACPHFSEKTMREWRLPAVS